LLASGDMRRQRYWTAERIEDLIRKDIKKEGHALSRSRFIRKHGQGAVSAIERGNVAPDVKTYYKFLGRMGINCKDIKKKTSSPILPHNEVVKYILKHSEDGVAQRRKDVPYQMVKSIESYNIRDQGRKVDTYGKFVKHIGLKTVFESRKKIYRSEAVYDYIQKNGAITNKELEDYLGVSVNIAHKYLAELLRERKIKSARIRGAKAHYRLINFIPERAESLADYVLDNISKIILEAEKTGKSRFFEIVEGRGYMIIGHRLKDLPNKSKAILNLHELSRVLQTINLLESECFSSEDSIKLGIKSKRAQQRLYNLLEEAGYIERENICEAFTLTPSGIKFAEDVFSIKSSEISLEEKVNEPLNRS